MAEFYVPQYRNELVELLASYYGVSKGQFEKMRKEQLYAIYYRLRRIEERQVVYENGGGR